MSVLFLVHFLSLFIYLPPFKYTQNKMEVNQGTHTYAYTYFPSNEQAECCSSKSIWIVFLVLLGTLVTYRYTIKLWGARYKHIHNNHFHLFARSFASLHRQSVQSELNTDFYIILDLKQAIRQSAIRIFSHF